MASSAYSTQHDSARRIAAKHGLTHGGIYRAEVTVGVTPERFSGAASVMAHFCSGRFSKLVTLREGDGIQIPVDDKDYRVQLPDGLHLVSQPGILRFQALIIPNGNLTIQTIKQPARFVYTPRWLRESSPWAWDGGNEEIAHELHFGSVDEMFNRIGNPVLA